MEYDVVIIGSGPGGYVCALRAAQLGLKTALIEKYQTLGGTCLNVGCIPSKAYLESSERFFDATHHFIDHGIEVKNITLHFQKMVGRVQEVVKQTCEGIKFLMKKNKVTVYHGLGEFVSPYEIKVGNEVLRAKNTVIATGSKPSSLPGIEIDKKVIITSTEALNLPTQPKSLILIGGGVIGLELGSVFARLGTKVQVVEYAPNICPMMDSDISKELMKCLKKEGMTFFTNHKVKSAVNVNGVAQVIATDDQNQEVKFTADLCLVAVGRRPYTEGLQLNNAGLTVDAKGKIVTNDSNQTQLPHIYAIGDVTNGPMLAHKAEEEGVYVAELIAGQKPHLNRHLIPSVVYTWPEVSSIGQSEIDLKKNGVPFKVGKFPFKASGRSRAGNITDGFIKVLAHQVTDEILGVHMIGPRVADLIAEAVFAMEYRATAEDVARICHAHPTYTEAFKEACLAATENRALHI